MEKTFEAKVRAMSAKQIIMAMVEGLQNPTTDEINMNTYGEKFGDKCFGCAATNAICRIAGKNFNYFESGERDISSMGSAHFIRLFEQAINYLRKGHIVLANSYLEAIVSVKIWNPLDISLPELTTERYHDNLQPYIDLANSQPE